LRWMVGVRSKYTGFLCALPYNLFTILGSFELSHCDEFNIYIIHNFSFFAFNSVLLRWVLDIRLLLVFEDTNRLALSG
jgi:hypothetical protein